VQTVAVTADEAGMRVDRFLAARFPGLPFSHIQRVIRKGELRVNGKRAQAKQRLAAGQAVRIPPLRLEQFQSGRSGTGRETRDFLKSITLYEDADVLVLNKPAGLAVQGGSGTRRHLDGMLEALRDAQGQRPRLVHRLDKDTAGCLLVALPPRRSPKPFVRARHAKSIGHWLPACRSRARVASPPFSPRNKPRMTRSCASRATARRGRVTP